MGRLQDKANKLEWEKNLVDIPSGSKVIVRYGIQKRPGIVLRRGYGRFCNEYRVQDDSDDTDSWVDCWRCYPTGLQQD